MNTPTDDSKLTEEKVLCDFTVNASQKNWVECVGRYSQPDCLPRNITLSM